MTWASSQSPPLQKISVNYWQSQNVNNTSGPCAITNAVPTLNSFPMSAGQWQDNISSSAWYCDGTVQVSFPGYPGPITCGPEVTQQFVLLPPFATPNVSWSAANTSKSYTVLFIDRDPINQRGPLLHGGYSNISGAAIAAGFTGPTGPSGVLSWFNYDGPKPPVNSSCHRYYVFLYEENPAVTPYMFVNFTNPTFRIKFNFPAWAANQSLTKISTNFWQTQNALNTGANGAACPSQPPPPLPTASPSPTPAVSPPPSPTPTRSPSPSSSARAAGAALPAVLALVLAGMLAVL